MSKTGAARWKESLSPSCSLVFWDCPHCGMTMKAPRFSSPCVVTWCVATERIYIIRRPNGCQTCDRRVQCLTDNLLMTMAMEE
jgi:hypothetical protein